jgi:hypothetical protein
MDGMRPRDLCRFLVLAALLSLPLAGPAAAGPASAGSGQTGSGALLAPVWLRRTLSPQGSPAASWEALLFAQLEEGDRRWQPRVQRLPNGQIRYSYRRRQGEAPLTLPQIQALLRQPLRFDQERQTIRELLVQLRRLGVAIELRTPRSPLAAGEWDPSRATLRVRPDVPAAGSLDFARVLNHEVIHVAQSCRGGGVRRPPVPLGLSRRLSRENAALMDLPLYAHLPARARLLEEEAFANQEDLSIGQVLLVRLCRTPSGY